MLNDNIYIKICLSDISAGQLYTSPQTGRTYVDLKIVKRKSPDRFGHTVSVELVKHSHQFNSDGTSKAPVYVGSGTDKFLPKKKK